MLLKSLSWARNGSSTGVISAPCGSSKGTRAVFSQRDLRAPGALIRARRIAISASGGDAAGHARPGEDPSSSFASFSMSAPTDLPDPVIKLSIEEALCLTPFTDDVDTKKALTSGIQSSDLRALLEKIPDGELEGVVTNLREETVNQMIGSITNGLTYEQILEAELADEDEDGDDDSSAGPLSEEDIAKKVASFTADDPAFDDLQIDAAYREWLKENKLDQIESQVRATDIDPEGIEFGPGGEILQGDPVGGEGTLDLEDLVESAPAPFGEPAVLCAGFRPEEVTQVRAILDAAGGHAIKVVPCSDRVLRESVAEALEEPEPAWEAPRPEDTAEDRTTSWGSKRTVLVGGMNLSAQLSVVSLLEESGLPPLSIAVAAPENAREQLGQVMARALVEQDDATRRQRDMMEDLSRQGKLTKSLPTDIEGFVKTRRPATTQPAPAEQQKEKTKEKEKEKEKAPPAPKKGFGKSPANPPPAAPKAPTAAPKSGSAIVDVLMKDPSPKRQSSKDLGVKALAELQRERSGADTAVPPLPEEVEAELRKMAESLAAKRVTEFCEDIKSEGWEKRQEERAEEFAQQVLDAWENYAAAQQDALMRAAATAAEKEDGSAEEEDGSEEAVIDVAAQTVEAFAPTPAAAAPPSVSVAAALDAILDPSGPESESESESEPVPAPSSSSANAEGVAYVNLLDEIAVTAGLTDDDDAPADERLAALHPDDQPPSTSAAATAPPPHSLKYPDRRRNPWLQVFAEDCHPSSFATDAIEALLSVGADPERLIQLIRDTSAAMGGPQPRALEHLAYPGDTAEELERRRLAAQIRAAEDRERAQRERLQRTEALRQMARERAGGAPSPPLSGQSSPSPSRAQTAEEYEAELKARGPAPARPPPKAVPLTVTELREVAARAGLNYVEVLQDVRAKGIEVVEE